MEFFPGLVHCWGVFGVDVDFMNRLKHLSSKRVLPYLCYHERLKFLSWKMNRPNKYASH